MCHCAYVKVFFSCMFGLIIALTAIGGVQEIKQSMKILRQKRENKSQPPII